MRAADLDLGWRSHLLATRHGGEQIERDDCIVVRTPGNPGYYWGNCLIVDEVADATCAHWQARFDEEIAPRAPAQRHVAIGVNAPLAGRSLPAWRAAGFDVLRTAVLCLEPGDAVPASPLPAGFTVRALRLPDEVPMAVDAQCADNDDGYEPAGYRAFRLRTMQRIAEMHALGHAHWFGVFADNALVADCGLVHDATMGRFQHVHTLPAWRRRGLCGALVRHACRYAFDALRVPRLVMCADPGDVAIGIYRRQGFAAVGEHLMLQIRAPADRA